MRGVFLERAGGEDQLPCNTSGREKRQRIDGDNEWRWHGEELRRVDGAGTGVKEPH
jgi:hypothetical protein